MPIQDLHLFQLHGRPDAWPTDAEAVAEIARSIAENGQFAPIIVRPTGTEETPTYEVVAGMQRLAAAQLLNHSTIKCDILILDDLQAEIVMIEQNFAVRQLGAAACALYRYRLKLLYLERYPETKAGIAGWRGSHKLANDKLSFAQVEAGRAGKTRRSIERDVARGEKIPAEVLRKIMGTCFDRGTELDALAVRSPEDQEDLARRAASGQKVTAKAPVTPRKLSTAPAAPVTDAAPAPSASRSGDLDVPPALTVPMRSATPSLDVIRMSEALAPNLVDADKTAVLNEEASSRDAEMFGRRVAAACEARFEEKIQTAEAERAAALKLARNKVHLWQYPRDAVARAADRAARELYDALVATLVDESEQLALKI